MSAEVESSGGAADAPAASSAVQPSVISVRGVAKTFFIGFFRKRVEAVRGIDFEVRRGEIFGLLGPNGAGKTTTIKTILRLIFPTAGEVRLFGNLPPGPEAMHRIGYMPENPYIYQYLRPLEFLDLCARLSGIPAAERDARCKRMIERVGLAHATDRPIGRFSKGMMQRIGLAQALVHEPELLVLDEPMSGLDPIGRKEIRDLILEERRKGRTILFTSHILSDVERLCNRVAIMHRGGVTAYGSLSELLAPGVERTEIELEAWSVELKSELDALEHVSVEESGPRLVVIARGAQGAREVIERAHAADARVVHVAELRETLEDLFVRDALASRAEGELAS